MISHDHKTVFVHIPKCGGQSIETMFLDDLGLNWKTRAPLLLRPNRDPAHGPPRLAHLTARDYVKFGYLNRDQFAAYYKFAIVRHPLTRVVSLYNYLKIDIGFVDFVQTWMREQFDLAPLYRQAAPQFPGDYYRIRPQHEYLCDEAGEMLVDDVFRLESIGSSVETIRARSGVRAPLKHVNKPKTIRIQLADVSAAEKAVIGELYKKDFEFLGYDLP